MVLVAMLITSDCFTLCLQGAIQGSVDLQDAEPAGITPAEDSHAVLGRLTVLAAKQHFDKKTVTATTVVEL